MNQSTPLHASALYYSCSPVSMSFPTGAEKGVSTMPIAPQTAGNVYRDYPTCKKSAVQTDRFKWLLYSSATCSEKNAVPGRACPLK